MISSLNWSNVVQITDTTDHYSINKLLLNKTWNSVLDQLAILQLVDSMLNMNAHRCNPAMSPKIQTAVFPLVNDGTLRV